MTERYRPEVAVSLKGVTKRFKLYHNIATGPMNEQIFFWKREQFYKEFVAVRDVSFEVRRGETVGIIGLNGAGKTTVLKMIAGLLHTDEGRIDITGRVTALLALGIGVHPEFTGRENILYSGMLLGVPKKKILAKIPSIVEFAELEDFIDRPFRTYSSGMMARLLFSISMAVDPDIMIIDEALATGDIHFIHKSQKYIRELCASGATIIFVSHSLNQVREICDRCILMDQGRILYDGETNEALNKYIELVYQNEATKIAAEEAATMGRKKFIGTGEIQVLDAFFTVEGNRSQTLNIGLPCQLHIEADSSRDFDSVSLCVEVYTEKSGLTFAFLPHAVTSEDGKDFTCFSLARGVSEITIDIPAFWAGDGKYSMSIELFPGDKDYHFSYDTCYCYYTRQWSFQAVYAANQSFQTGTLGELPVSQVAVENRSSDGPGNKQMYKLSKTARNVF